MQNTMSEEPLIAVFVDFENLAIGVRDMKVGKFQIQLVLKRLLEKGRLVYKRAYCDWSNYRDAVQEFHSHGIELIDIPQRRTSGKNSADIRMVVDALDLCYSKQHIDVFALISGDSDFSPLVSKLKENNKRVIGCGAKSSTSDLLISNCDEFLYYDDLIRVAKAPRPRAEERQAGGGQEGGSHRTGAGRAALRGAGLRSLVGLDAQAGDPARPSQLQRGILRLRELLRSARGHQGEGADRTGIRREPGELQSASKERPQALNGPPFQAKQPSLGVAVSPHGRHLARPGGCRVFDNSSENPSCHSLCHVRHLAAGVECGSVPKENRDEPA